MSQNYNINMKKFNGTDYDGLLPLAYNALNSQQLDGKTFNEIYNLFTSTDLYLYTGTYLGTGTSRENNPTTLTFPFEPVLLLGPHPSDMQSSTVIIYNEISTSYNNGYWFNNSRVSIKKSNDNKTISWFGETPSQQCNFDNVTYWFAAIGGYDRGGQTEWVITQSGTWTVPKTGRYMLELYGKGGNGARNEYRGSSVGSGGASCQAYDEISLSSGDIINIVIDSGRTSFGNYTVDAATSAHWDNRTGTMTPGVGTGNKGANGTYNHLSANDWPAVYGTGTFSQKYGYGGGAAYNSYGTNGGPAAVYIKYLGA